MALSARCNGTRVFYGYPQLRAINRSPDTFPLHTIYLGPATFSRHSFHTEKHHTEMKTMDDDRTPHTRSNDVDDDDDG